MKLIIEYASTDEQKEMESAYFNFFTALYGRNLTTNAIWRRLAKGKEISPILTYFDTNYGKTLEAIDSAYGEDEYLTMLRISTPEYIDPLTGRPQVLAYARLNWALEGVSSLEKESEYYTEDTSLERNKKNAGVPDIALTVPMREIIAEEFYLSVIRELENWVAERNEETEIISHEVPCDNDAYLNAIFNAGDYEHENEPGSLTVMFDKYIRNKPLTRKIKQ